METNRTLIFTVADYPSDLQPLALMRADSFPVGMEPEDIVKVVQMAKTSTMPRPRTRLIFMKARTWRRVGERVCHASFVNPSGRKPKSKVDERQESLW